MDEWRPVVGFEGRYEVSRDGRVRRLAYEVRGASRGADGYRVISLTDGSLVHRRYVHRLVAEAFHGSAPDGRRVVHHRDSDTSNNAAENLEWTSSGENTRYAIQRLGRFGGIRKHSA